MYIMRFCKDKVPDEKIKKALFWTGFFYYIFIVNNYALIFRSSFFIFIRGGKTLWISHLEPFNPYANLYSLTVYHCPHSPAINFLQEHCQQ